MNLQFLKNFMLSTLGMKNNLKSFCVKYTAKQLLKHIQQINNQNKHKKNIALKNKFETII